MKRILFTAVLMLLAPQSQVSVVQQPQAQTAQFGQTATFSAQASSGPCRTVILKNGKMLKWGPITAADGIVSYTTPALTVADNGTKYSFEFYNCPVSGQVTTTQALLTVTQPTTSAVALKISGSALFDDGAPVMPNASATANQLQNGAMVQIGKVASDASGNLSGTIAVAPQFTDANGMVCMSLTLAGIPLAGSQCVDPREFQQGSSGITIKVVVFRSTVLPKSVSVALVP